MEGRTSVILLWWLTSEVPQKQYMDPRSPPTTSRKLQIKRERPLTMMKELARKNIKRQISTTQETPAWSEWAVFNSVASSYLCWVPRFSEDNIKWIIRECCSEALSWNSLFYALKIKMFLSIILFIILSLLTMCVPK